MATPAMAETAGTIGLDEALARVLAAPRGRLPAGTVPLGAARGRHLAEAVHTEGPWPATDRSAMDGFALRAGSGLPAGHRLPVVGESLAGRPFAGPLPPGAAVRIMTGGVVPDGADAVVPVEQTSGFGAAPPGGAGTAATVELRAAVRRGQNVRPAGSEARAGETALRAGRRLRAAEIGVLAVLGRGEVPVVDRPRVAIVATGDEVVPVEAAPAPHQLRDSNSWALAAQVEEAGGAPARLGTAPDEPEALVALLRRGLDAADVLLTIGGVSKGTHDLVHGTLAALGVEAVFHGIDLKPGKPTFFGVRRAAAGGNPRDCFVLGLPGNPASCFTVFDLLGRPLLARLLGAEAGPWRASARIGGAPFRPNARVQAAPAVFAVRDGELWAELLPPSPSGDPFALSRAGGYALLPAGAEPGAGLRAPVLGFGDGIEPAPGNDTA